MEFCGLPDGRPYPKQGSTYQGSHFKWFAANYWAQGSYVTLEAGGEAKEWWIEFRNTGRAAWENHNYNNHITKLALGSYDEPDMQAGREFNDGWESPTRLAIMDQDAVYPGGVGRFTFRVRASADRQPGTYRLVVTPKTPYGWVKQDDCSPSYCFLEITVVKPEVKQEVQSTNKQSAATNDQQLFPSSNIDALFSDQEAGTTSLSCDTFTPRRQIKFLIDMGTKNGELPFLADVNEKGDEALPYMSEYDYWLAGNQYDGAVRLTVDGKQRTLIPDLSLFPPDEDDLCRVFVGSPGETQGSAVWSANQAIPEEISKEPTTTQELDSETVVMWEASEAPPSGISEGKHDIESVDNRLLIWLANQMAGTNLPPLFKDLATMGARANERAFLRDLFFGGSFYIKQTNGRFYIIFKGYPGLRTFINSARYSVDNAKVSIVSMYAQAATKTPSGISSAVRSASKGNLISFVIVGAVDVFEYYSLPENERVFSDLLVDLAVDFGKVFVAGYAALLGGAAVIALAGTAPVWVVIAGAIAVGVAVGFGLDWLDEKLGFTAGLKQVAARASEFIVDLHLPQAVTAAAQEMREVWSALTLPEAKIIQLAPYIREAPSRMIRNSPAVQPNLIAAIMLDVMRCHSDLRLIEKALIDSEAKFIEFYEGDAETFELWALKKTTGHAMEDLGVGIGHMNAITVKDLVENRYLRQEKNWDGDWLDISLNWLADHARVPVLIGARLARISQYWYTMSDGEVNISENQAVLASLYYMGLAGPKGVHANPTANEDGARIVALITEAEKLLEVGQ